MHCAMYSQCHKVCHTYERTIEGHSFSLRRDHKLGLQQNANFHVRMLKQSETKMIRDRTRAVKMSSAERSNKCRQAQRAAAELAQQQLLANEKKKREDEEEAKRRAAINARQRASRAAKLARDNFLCKFCGAEGHGEPASKTGCSNYCSECDVIGHATNQCPVRADEEKRRTGINNDAKAYKVSACGRCIIS